MKTFLNYLFVLCPSIVIYGCSNDDKDRKFVHILPLNVKMQKEI